ncbi:hypothetical protein CGRA01v4_13814 [Colletotrichum graminicola]|nr:hypothetical protein CGRA01v4_13814 [Colletotrichum graminicola]
MSTACMTAYHQENCPMVFNVDKNTGDVAIEKREVAETGHELRRSVGVVLLPVCGYLLTLWDKFVGGGLLFRYIHLEGAVHDFLRCVEGKPL